MKVTITKFIDLQLIRYWLQRTADIPGEIIQPGLVLSGLTEKPTVDLVVAKVIYHRQPTDRQPFSQEIPDVHLVCETSNSVSGSDPGLEWVAEAYGREWEIKRLPNGQKP